MDHRNLDEIEVREVAPGAKARFVHSEKMTFAYWNIEAGAGVPEHTHPHEQVVNVMNGEFELTVDGVTQKLGPGSVVVLPPHAVHSGAAITDSFILDVFCPVREDYK